MKFYSELTIMSSNMVRNILMPVSKTYFRLFYASLQYQKCIIVY